MSSPGHDPQPALFDGPALLNLLAEVDAELPEGSVVEIAVIGGAALTVRWADRMSMDVDVVSDFMPPELRTAGAAVAPVTGCGRQPSPRPIMIATRRAGR